MISLFLRYVIEFIKFYVMYRLGFQIRAARCVWGIGAVFAVIMSVYLKYFEYICNPIIIYMIGIWIVTLIGFEFSVRKGIIIGFWSACVISLFDLLEQQCIQLLIPEYEMFEENIWASIVGCITVVVLIVFLKLINKKYNRGIQDVAIGYYIFFLYMGIMYELILSFIKKFLSNRGMLYNVMILSIGVITFLQMFLLMALAIANKVNHEQIHINKKYLIQQVNYYQYLEKKERKTREFRHDIKKHMYMLNEYAQKANNSEIQKYLEEMFGIVNVTGNYVSIGNEVIDAILNQYVEICQSENVKLKIKGRMPLYCRINAFDLCTIVSNFMQNALEAALKTEEKWINVFFRYDEDVIYIQIKNSTINKANEKRGFLQTTKKDVENHGYGFSNMKSCVEKYGGSVEYINKENIFLLQLIIPNKK